MADANRPSAAAVRAGMLLLRYDADFARIVAVRGQAMDGVVAWGGVGEGGRHQRPD